VLNNPADSGKGEWSIPCGGFTDALDYKIPVENRSQAHISGYWFSRMTKSKETYYNDQYQEQQPHIWVTEWDDTAGSLNVSSDELWLSNDGSTTEMSEGEYVRFTSLTDLKENIVNILNANYTGNCTFSISSDGDIVYENTTDGNTLYVWLRGPAAFVAGIGYIELSRVNNMLEDQLSRGRPLQGQAVVQCSAFQL
jgi:hypothetical protein